MKFSVAAIVLFGLVSTQDDYIIGGDEVTQAGKWPWQGSMQINGVHSCGICLIGTSWGLTAAHCIDSSSAMTFQFGSNNRKTGGVVVEWKQFIKMYGMGEGLYPNDIAVVQFNELVMDENIQTIPLTMLGQEHAGNLDCWITGWGHTEFGGSLPATLHEAQIEVYTLKYCRDYWGDGNISNGQVCIGDVPNGRTSCNGDSGGPLVCSVDGRYELVGAMSWGQSYCQSSTPAVYTRIAYFRD